MSPTHTFSPSACFYCAIIGAWFPGDFIAFHNFSVLHSVGWGTIFYSRPNFHVHHREKQIFILIPGEILQFSLHGVKFISRFSKALPLAYVKVRQNPTPARSSTIKMRHSPRQIYFIYAFIILSLDGNFFPQTALFRKLFINGMNLIVVLVVGMQTLKWN